MQNHCRQMNLYFYLKDTIPPLHETSTDRSITEGKFSSWRHDKVQRSSAQSEGWKVGQPRSGENIPASFSVTANKPYWALCLKARGTVGEYGSKLNWRFVLWMDSCFCRKPQFQQSPCKAPFLITAKPQPPGSHRHTL